jgi:hypothetical protein
VASLEIADELLEALGLDEIPQYPPSAIRAGRE